VLGGLLAGVLEGAEVALVAPEAVVGRILLLYEGIVRNVSGEEGRVLGGVGVLGDVAEGAAELVLAVFARDVSAVPGDLRSWIRLTHP